MKRGLPRWPSQSPPQMSPSGAPLRGATWEPEHEQEQPERPLVPRWQGPALRSAELEAPLMKRQLKHRQNKDSKLAKKFKSLNAEISNLKSQIGVLEDKITRASGSTNARFKRKKIRSMKREVNKIGEKLRESEKALRAVEPRVPLKLHPLNRNKRIEAKIADLNKKIRRVKNNKNERFLKPKENP